ncbi:MAG: 3-hydroxyacyl-CoA dehydrogenase [Proteobacteria bacterium]|nr:3-hydroxyacyl-CoA dehydrogenase [Pseudomonadota bacterium]
MAAAKGKVAVIGAGLIGRAWAIVFARGGHPVALFDADPAASRRAIDVIAGGLRDLAAHDLLAEAPAAVLARIAVATRIEAAIADAALVQENGPEAIATKQELFATLDRMAPAATILASSTSTIPASVFTESLAGRSRCLVAHPVNPPYLVPLVELAPAPWTAAEVVARARALYAGLGQTPILVKREIPGFILNRLQAALLAEAFRLVEDDFVSIDDLDKTLSDGLGLRWSFMGPFETIELNAPGGVRDYVARYGQAIYELAKTQADPRPWNAALVDRIERERRAVLPAAGLAARQAWRDRRLMALAAHKRDAAKHEQES